MHDRFGLVGGENLIQPGAVVQVALLEGAEFHGLLPSGAQVVIGDGGISGGFQDLAGMRPDISGTAGDKDIGQCPPPGDLLRGFFRMDNVIQIRPEIVAKFITGKAKATVACRNPALEPQSNRWPLKR